MPSQSEIGTTPSYLQKENGAKIAYHRLEATRPDLPGLIFLGGLVSDMTGTKATALEAHAKSRGQGFLRFDYQGHGASSGRFEEGTISLWASDALAAFDSLSEGPQILIGSSMGGWIALLLALARPDRVAALVGIAAAPDFTKAMWASFSSEVRDQITKEGRYAMPSDYGDEPYIITRELIEDGGENCLLDSSISITCPVRLLQGTADSDVPWPTAPRILEKLESEDAEAILIKDGDHRLSSERDLARLSCILDQLSGIEG